MDTVKLARVRRRERASGSRGSIEVVCRKRNGILGNLNYFVFRLDTGFLRTESPKCLMLLK